MTKDPLSFLSAISHFKSILCLDGVLPAKGFFNIDLPVIAADGAANQLLSLGITPQIVIGDLDSILPENLAKLASYYHYDQNYCDYEKSLAYLEENDLLPAIVVGINGGYLDHIMNNINIFMQGNNVLYAPPIYGFVMQAGATKTLSLARDTKISLLGIPSATVSSKGLKWELQQKILSFPGDTSCFNRASADSIQIEVFTGKVLVLIYL